MICTNMICIMCDMTQCGMYGMLYISQREGGGNGWGPKIQCFSLNHRLSFFSFFPFFLSLLHEDFTRSFHQLILKKIKLAHHAHENGP